jgi:hypothetical protein
MAMTPFHGTTPYGQPFLPGPSIVQMFLLLLQVPGYLVHGVVGGFTPRTTTICHHLGHLTLVNQGHLLGYPVPGLFTTTGGQPSSSSIQVF